MKDKFGNEIDLDYCETRNIQSTWFKFENQLTDWLYELIEGEEASTEESMCGYSKKLLQTIGLLTVAIILYKHDNFVPVELEQTILKSMALKIPYKHAKKSIDESRIKLAERISNGSKGGRPSNHANYDDEMQEV